MLQERISTISYFSPSMPDAAGEKFKFFLFLNMVQSLIAALSSLFYSAVLGVHVWKINGKLGWSYLKVATASLIASPLGYHSLKHINYPTMIIGKSCKLVPVMLMNMLLYRKRFPLSKYLTVALVTVGVCGFMWAGGGDEKHSKAASAVKTNSLIGVGLLCGNLLLDGVVNSLQDKIFIQHPGVNSQHMMFWMNLLSTAALAAWLLVEPLLIGGGSGELKLALAFVGRYPRCLMDVVAFGICGALGQNFIFYTLQKFGSLSLVMVTVTRKLVTIVISLVYFEHRLCGVQWAFVGVVFVALLMESLVKVCSGKAGKKAGKGELKKHK